MCLSMIAFAIILSEFENITMTFTINIKCTVHTQSITINEGR